MSKMKVVFLVLFAVFLMAFSSGCGASGNPGEIGIVHNGGPFDNKNIRQVIAPGAGYSWVGLGSSVNFYPSSNVQRFYTISTDPNQTERGGATQVCVPTSDGVNVCLEGTIYFHTAFDASPQGENLAKDFDLQYGLRTYPDVSNPGHLVHPYNGDDGWSSFLNSVVRPVIDNELRQAIGTTQCQELVASCALVANAGRVTPTQVSNGGTSSNQIRISEVQAAVNQGLQSDITNTLGKAYLTGINFRLARVQLPSNVQSAINQAQSAFAQVATAQAGVQAAKQLNEANKLKQKVYEHCSACAQIDEIKALQGLKGTGVTVFFGVNNPNVTVPVK